MKRALFNLMTLASAVLCAALLLAWQRSPWGLDADSQRRVNVGGGAWFVGSWGGGLRVVRQCVHDGGVAANGLVATPDRLGCWDIRSDGAPLASDRFGPEGPAHGALGFGWGRKEYTRTVLRLSPTPVPAKPGTAATFTMDYVVLAAPYWALAPLAGLLPALWVRRWRRVRRWEVSGRCPKCGYDLRAAPDSIGALLPRCPECGWVEGEVSPAQVGP